MTLEHERLDVYQNSWRDQVRELESVYEYEYEYGTDGGLTSRCRPL